MAKIYCMNCGVELEEGTRFCNVCGSPTLLGAGLLDAGDVAEQACPSCGALNAAGSERCASCGALLSNGLRETRHPSRDLLAGYDVPALERHSSRPSALLMGGIAALVVVGLLIGGLAVSGALGRFHGEAPVSQREGGSSDANDESVDAAPSGSAGVEVRDALADYTWEELSVIGKALTRQSTREAALELAREYNLVDADGHILDATKDVELTGLGTLHMRLVDVYHDDLANGEGKAGLSFLAADASLLHRMNATNGIEGGWEASELRSWLNTTVLGCMDETLRTSIMAVDKHTNNVGHTTDASSVTSTFDMLWLPSMAEVTGPIDWTWPSDPSNSKGYNATTNAEGDQYAFFAEQGVRALEGNALLVAQGADGPVTWWERSAVPSGYTRFRAVSKAGDPTEIWDATSELGVCLGFCL